MPLTRGVRCGRRSWWFSDLARFRGGFWSLCLCFGVYVSEGGGVSGWVFVFMARFGMILDGGIWLQDGLCGGFGLILWVWILRLMDFIIDFFWLMGFVVDSGWVYGG